MRWDAWDIDVTPCAIKTLEKLYAFCEEPDIYEHPPCASLYLTESGVKDSILLRLLKLEGACSHAYMIMSHCEDMKHDVRIQLERDDLSSKNSEHLLWQQEQIKTEVMRRQMQYGASVDQLGRFARRCVNTMKRERHPTTAPLSTSEYRKSVSKSKEVAGTAVTSCDCYICHEAIRTGKTSHSLACGHKFHSRCLKRWLLNEHPTCPTCRYCPRAS